jgi:hypothetical protein
MEHSVAGPGVNKARFSKRCLPIHLGNQRRSKIDHFLVAVIKLGLLMASPYLRPTVDKTRPAEILSLAGRMERGSDLSYLKIAKAKKCWHLANSRQS